MSNIRCPSDIPIPDLSNILSCATSSSASWLFLIGTISEPYNIAAVLSRTPSPSFLLKLFYRTSYLTFFCMYSNLLTHTTSPLFHTLLCSGPLTVLKVLFFISTSCNITVELMPLSFTHMYSVFLQIVKDISSLKLTSLCGWKIL